MVPTEQQRESRYQQSSPSVQEVYAGAHTGVLLRKIFEQHQLRDNLYYEYTQAFGDVVLGFVQQADMASIFQDRLGLPRPTAEHLAETLRALLPHEEIADSKTPAPTIVREAGFSATPKPAPVPSVVTPASPLTTAPAATTPPAWSTAPKPVSPTAESSTPEEKPFYPRVPNYSKPFTTGPAPATSSAAPPRPSAPPSAPQPRTSDPYHEPI